MDESNNTIFTHAKLEYTAQLVDMLTPQIFDGIRSIYEESKKVYKTDIRDKSILILFRTFLEKVPTWSNEVIETETNRIITMSTCDWLNDLITAVFISHTKILTVIGSNSSSNIELVIPKTINFIHKCYINIAREVWKNPYLFDESVPGSEYQKNMRTIEIMIKESIENTIRKLLPVKEILKQHLDIYETNEIKNKVSQDDIRKMLLEEIKSLNKGDKVEENDNEDNNDDNNYDNNGNDKCDISEDNGVLKEDSIIAETSNMNNGNEKDTYNENNIDNENETVSVNNDEKYIKEENGLIDEDDFKDKYHQSEEGYVSPDEDEIKDRCKDLDINNIPNVLENDPDIIKEEEYDNIDIFIDDENKGKGDDNKSILHTYIDNLPSSSDIRDNGDHNEIIDKEVDIKKVDEEEGNNLNHIINDKLNDNQLDSNILADDKKNDGEVNDGKLDDDKLDDNKLDDDKLDNGKLDDKEKIEDVIIIKKDDIINENLGGEDTKTFEKEDNDKKIIDVVKGPSNIPLVSDTVKEVTDDKLGEDPLFENIIVNDKNVKSDESRKETEIISIDKNDDSMETETVDLFFEDVSKLMEKRGLEVNKESKTYTLFDDVENEIE